MAQSSAASAEGSLNDFSRRRKAVLSCLFTARYDISPAVARPQILHLKCLFLRQSQTESHQKTQTVIGGHWQSSLGAS